MRRVIALTILLIFYIGMLSAQCDRQRDSLALVALYNSTDGPNWTNTWDLSRSMDGWGGVTLSVEGCIVELSLQNNNLIGKVPIEISQLTELVEFNLGNPSIGSNLIDKIPKGLFELKNLTRLDLGYLGIIDTISYDLGKLTNLTNLRLTGNSLYGSIPPQIGKLKELSILSLAGNSITGRIPIEIYSLNQLSFLNLSSNQLRDTLSTHVINLKNLKFLGLAINNLSGFIPAEIGELKQLEDLWLWDNKFIGSLPESIALLNKIQSIYLNQNELSGCIPLRFLNFCPLGQTEPMDKDGFNFSDNQLLPWQGDFERFCNGEEQIGAPCVVDGQEGVINVDCRCLVETSCNREADSLELVKFYSSTDGPNWTHSWDLNQPVDTWWGIELNEQGCVTRLDLDGNTQGICCETADEHNIGNNLTGIWPVMELPELRVIDLTKNNLTGTIPDLSGSPKLEFVDIASNNFSGGIGPQIASNFQLTNLWIQGNPQIGGSLPIELSNLPKFRSFLGWNCGFTGELPQEYGGIDSMTTLMVGSNNLFGEIPNSYCQLSKLNWLWIENNKLSGDIPKELFDLPLTSFVFDKNCLSFDGSMASYVSENKWQRFFSDGNKLTFENLINSVDIIQEQVDQHKEEGEVHFLSYSPQDSIYQDTTIVVSEGDELVIDLLIDEGVETNSYTWLKNGEVVDIIQGNNDLLFSSIAQKDEGKYNVYVTNPLVPELTLYSKQINIVVNDTVSNQRIYIPNVFSTNPFSSNYQWVVSSEGVNVISYEIFLEGRLVHSGQINATVRDALWDGSNGFNIDRCETNNTFTYNMLVEYINGSNDTLYGEICRIKNNTNCNCSIPIEEMRWPTQVSNAQFSPGSGSVGFLSSDDVNNCSDNVPESCFDDIEFKLTSYITPDGDGMNDILRFTSQASLSNSEIYIYNRWGKQIYHAKPYGNNWSADGYPDGVYYYVLTYDGQLHKSTVTVVR